MTSPPEPASAAGTPRTEEPTTVPTTDADGARRRMRFEVVATLLLTFAAVATAWSGYQAARWSAEANKASSQVNALRIDAASTQGLAEGQTQVDVAMFFEWVDADQKGDTDLAGFYEDRFRPEFRPAFESWLATAPIDEDSPPGTPFAQAEYQLAAADEAAELDREAEATGVVVRRNLQRSTNYVLGVVLFSVALFFAGISTKMSGAGPRLVLLACGSAVFVGTAWWIATSPISFSI